MGWRGRYGQTRGRSLHGRSRRPPRVNDQRSFVIRCSRAIFALDEIKILEQYGRELERLASGEREPETAAQQRFVEAVHGRLEPETIYERTWAKYAWRLEWEAKPENKSAMGERRSMPNDREDWKRMRGAVWGDMKRRSRGLDC